METLLAAHRATIAELEAKLARSETYLASHRRTNDELETRYLRAEAAQALARDAIEAMRPFLPDPSEFCEGCGCVEARQLADQALAALNPKPEGETR